MPVFLGRLGIVGLGEDKRLPLLAPQCIDQLEAGVGEGQRTGEFRLKVFLVGPANLQRSRGKGLTGLAVRPLGLGSLAHTLLVLRY